MPAFFKKREPAAKLDDDLQKHNNFLVNHAYPTVENTEKREVMKAIREYREAFKKDSNSTDSAAKLEALVKATHDNPLYARGTKTTKLLNETLRLAGKEEAYKNLQQGYHQMTSRELSLYEKIQEHRIELSKRGTPGKPGETYSEFQARAQIHLDKGHALDVASNFLKYPNGKTPTTFYNKETQKIEQTGEESNKDLLHSIPKNQPRYDKGIMSETKKLINETYKIAKSSHYSKSLKEKVSEKVNTKLDEAINIIRRGFGR